jgi:flagellar hook-basal body complex protein FliE
MEINRINSKFTDLSSITEDSNNDNGIESFKSLLNDKLNQVNQLQVNSENASADFINGGDIDIHQVMLSAEEAKMSIEMAVQVRNKIVEAYQEINRMQL